MRKTVWQQDNSVFILEQKLIPKILCQPSRSSPAFTNQAVIYCSDFITKITKIFHTLLTVSVCVVTWATL